MLLLYCVAVAGASIAGGLAPVGFRLDHTRMQKLMSLVGGLMCGVAIMHMMPHAVVATGSVDRVAGWMVVGLLGMFFLIRAFHVHQHAHDDELVDAATRPPCRDHDHDHDHDHAHDHAHGAAHGSLHEELQPHGVAWAGLFFGLTVHSLIDGLALAAAVIGGGHDGLWAGVGTFLAVVLHKPLDALSITTVMTRGGWSRQMVLLVNSLFAAACPLGALAFLSGVESLAGWQQQLVGCALAFSAGVFLCISLADILPEVQFHAHDRLPLSVCLLFGFALAYGIGFLEPQHTHEHTIESQDNKNGQESPSY